MSQARSQIRKGKILPLYREWRLPEPLDPCLVERLSHEAPLLPEVAAVLLRRSGGDPEKARLMRGSSWLALPQMAGIMDIPGLRCAAERIAQAIAGGERIVAYSDFDADGVTSATVVKEALDLAGAGNVSVYFPSRFTDGYGFHAASVKDIAANGACLFVTSDCGITSFDACEEAARRDCDVIVTDHHLPADRLPRAHSVLDPHIAAWEPLDFRELTGAGVAYLLAHALFRVLGLEDKVAPSWAHDLLTLSIAGDGHPVSGLNRAWVVSGLRVLAEAERPGVAALLQVAGIYQEGGERRPLAFDRDVTFGLVPRLNAAGRLRDARLAFDILTERDPVKAWPLAVELNRLNQERRGIEDVIMEQCLGDLGNLGDEGYVVCASRPEWHEGVIGIAASKLREAFGRPAALAGGDGDLLKGSVRGIPGFNVVEALSRCGDLLAGFGGHEAAGGFTVRRDLVGRFFDRFGSVSAELLSGTSISASLDLDEVLTLERASDEILRGFFDLEPFGQGNSLPQAACMDCDIEQVSLMGKTKDHLQITLSKGGASRRFIWFGRGKEARTIALMGRVDVAFTPYRSVYLGEEQVTPLIKDIRPAWQSSGAGYSGLVEEVIGYGAPDGSPAERAVVYTWSPHAAECLWTAVRKSGRAAAVHLEGQTRIQSHEARFILNKSGGVVISTAPWELPVSPGVTPKVFLAHPPVLEAYAERLVALLSERSAGYTVWSGWETDSLNWLSWTYPEKDSVGSVWKSLKKRSNEGRLPYASALRRWEEVIGEAGFSPGCPGSFEGGRLLVERSLRILEELGMVEYVETRRAPELVLCRGGERILLSGSRTYLDGKAIREGVAETWRGRLGAYLFDRRGN